MGFLLAQRRHEADNFPWLRIVFAVIRTRSLRFPELLLSLLAQVADHMYSFPWLGCAISGPG